MSDKQLDDLKRFITTTISESEKRLEKRIDSAISDLRNELRSEFKRELRAEIHGLRQEMLDGFAGVGDAIEGIYSYLHQHPLHR